MTALQSSMGIGEQTPQGLLFAETPVLPASKGENKYLCPHCGWEMVTAQSWVLRGHIAKYHPEQKEMPETKGEAR